MSPLWCRRRRPQRRPRCQLLVERLADRILPAGASLATALAISPSAVAGDDLRTPGEVDFYQFTLPETGRLTVRTQGAGLDTRTTLLGPEGELLVQSDGA